MPTPSRRLRWPITAAGAARWSGGGGVRRASRSASAVPPGASAKPARPLSAAISCRSVRLSGIGRSGRGDHDLDAPARRPEQQFPRHHPARAPRAAWCARAIRRRVRSPGSAEERARSPRRAERSRAADPQEAKRRTARPRAQGRQRAACRRRARSDARAARDAQERDAAEDPGREEHPGARRGAGASSKQLKTTYDLKRRAGRRRPPDPARSAATAPRTRCGRRRATPTAWPSSRRSPAWPSCDRSGSRTTWRRCRKGRKSAAACRSSTS